MTPPAQNDETVVKLPKLGARQDRNVVLDYAELHPALRAFVIEQRRAALTLAHSAERLLGLSTEEAKLRTEIAQLRTQIAALRAEVAQLRATV